MSFAVHTNGKYADIGTNGSQTCMMAMFFAAYAAKDRPEAERAANWVEPIRFGEYPIDYPQYSQSVERPQNRGPRQAHLAHIRKLLAYRPEEQIWIDLAHHRQAFHRSKSNRTIDRALTLKPPRDPVLKGLVRLYKAAVVGYDSKDPEDSVIPAEAVEAVADAVQEVLPDLAETGFWRRGGEVLAVLLFALAHDQDVRCG